MFRKILKITSIVLASLVLLAFATVLVLWLSTSGYRLDAEKLQLKESSAVFLDVNDREIERSSVGAVSLAELPAYTPWAFVCVEDKTFYEHSGVSVKRIFGAAAHNLRAMRFKEGGSTISQQLIKNTHLTNEKTLRRKFAELRLTRQLEKQYDKQQILELYLNSIYFGKCGYGIGNAARGFFGKAAADLTVAESAALAGVINSPSRYSPYQHPDNFLARKNLVLKLMRVQGRLTEEEYETALAETPTIRDGEVCADRSYLNGAVDECESILRTGQKSWVGQNLRIYTYLDPEVQKLAQNAAKCQLLDVEYCANIDNSIVIMDNRTRAVLALSSTLNFAAESRRQPASAIKPLLVYAPAVEADLVEPATILHDAKTSVEGFSPSNYQDKYYGDVSTRFALANSLNVPAVRLLSDLGVERGMNALARNGLATEREDYHLASALGGFSHGFTLPQLVNGYATLADGGKFRDLAFVRKIERGGKVVYDAESARKSRRVFSEQTAFLVSDMLRDSVSSGTAKALRPLNIPLCAKTGTNGTADGNRDAYTLSYNPRYTVGVWVGSDALFDNRVTGGTYPCRAARQVWEGLRSSRSATDFPDFAVPDGVYRQTVDADSLRADGKFVLADENAPAAAKLTDYFKRRLTECCTRYSSPTVADLSFSREGDALYCRFRTEKGFVYRLYDAANGKTTLLREFDGDGETVEYRTQPLKGAHRLRVVALYPERETSGVPVDSEEYSFGCNFVPGGAGKPDGDNSGLDRTSGDEDGSNKNGDDRASGTDGTGGDGSNGNSPDRSGDSQDFDRNEDGSGGKPSTEGRDGDQDPSGSGQGNSHQNGDSIWWW